MASAVDLCNLGLSNFGQRAVVASISPPDNTVEAQLCARYYPLARDEMLSAHLWGFAMTRTALQIVADAAPASWQFAYQVPNGMLRLADVIDPTVASDGLESYYLADGGYYLLDDQVRAPAPPYIREGDLIFTNIENAVARHTQLITDTTKYPALLCTAISLRLGAFLSGNIVKGKEGIAIRTGLSKEAYAILGVAESHDGRGERTNTYRNNIPDSILSRR